MKAIKEQKIPTKIKEWEVSWGLQTSTDILLRILVTRQNLFNETQEWKWDNECQKTFKELKDKITIQSVLVLPKRDKKFRVEINISGYAIKGVLSQEQEEK